MLKHVTFSEVDTTEEIAKEFNKLIDNMNLMENKICQMAKTKSEKKADKKAKGSVMTKLLCVLVALTLCVSMALGYVANDINYDIASNPQMLVQYLRDTVGAGNYLFTPTDTVPDADEGRLYYNATADALELYTGSAWVTIEASSGNSLDSAYNLGHGITVDGTAITLTVGASVDNSALAIVHGETSNNNDAFTITNAGTGDAISVDGASTGNLFYDEDGNFTIASTGIVTAVGLSVGSSDIVFTEPTSYDITLTADTDNEFEIAGSEDFTIGLGTGDQIDFSSDSAATVLEFTTLDNLQGIEKIVADNEDFELEMTGTGAGYDLFVQQLGTIEVGVVIGSAGTGKDTIKIVSTAGGLDVDALDDISITVASTTAGDDLTLNQTGGNNSSITATAAGTADDAIGLIASAGGIDITSAKDIDITTVGTATEDISITNTGGSIIVTATEDIAETITITTNGGTYETIKLYANQGTSVTETAASIQLLSDDGGISLASTGDLVKAIQIVANGGTYETIYIQADQGTSVTEGAASIGIISDAGGVELRSTADLANAIALTNDGGTTGSILIFNDQGAGTTEGAASIQLLSDDGGVEMRSTANLARSVNLTSDGGTTGSIWIFNDQGSGAAGTSETDASIQLASDVGGIGLYSALDGDNAIRLETNGGTNETIMVRSTMGRSARAIALIAPLGGIEIAGGTYEDIEIVSTNASSDAIELRAATGAGGITLNAGSGGITMSGDTVKNYLKEVELEATTAETVLAADSGKVFVNEANAGTTTYTLPTCAVGLVYTFIDISAANHDNIIITAGASDSINGGTVAKKYRNYNDAVPMSVTLVGVTVASWEIISRVGTWENDNV